MSTEPLVTATLLNKNYIRGDEHVHALKDVSLSIPQGQFLAIMGASGSGKSTLLQLLGGLDQPSSGTLNIAGNPIGKLDENKLSLFRRTKLGFVFQFFHLIPSLTALENVLLPSLFDGKGNVKSLEARAENLLFQLNLSHRIHHYPAQLSGGEMQRVAIARALMNDPLLLLADEPTGNLDSRTGLHVLEILKNQKNKRTLVMVTHDPKVASFADRVIVLQDGQVIEDRIVVL